MKVVRAGVALTDHEKSLFTSEAQRDGAAGRPPLHRRRHHRRRDRRRAGRPPLPGDALLPAARPGRAGPRAADVGARGRSAPASSSPARSRPPTAPGSSTATSSRATSSSRTYQEPALTDFGIAGHLSEVDQDAEVRISYPWAPPELIDGRSNGSVASDVYSLGATIWNLLTGRSPFSDPRRRQLLPEPHHPRPARRIPRRCSARTHRAALDRLLQLCLAKRPELRPRSALELARELQRIESAAGYTRTPIAVAGDQPVVATTAPRRRRRATPPRSNRSASRPPVPGRLGSIGPPDDPGRTAPRAREPVDRSSGRRGRRRAGRAGRVLVDHARRRRPA